MRKESTRPSNKKEKPSRYGHTQEATTDMMAGHKTFVFDENNLEDIFEPLEETGIILEKYPMLVSDKVEFPKSKMTFADWNAIQSGKWTIEQLKSLIYSNNLVPPAAAKKENLINYILENRSVIF